MCEVQRFADILLQPGDFYNFQATFLALTDAVATITVVNNTQSDPSFKFDMRGTTTMVDPCAGISFFPNPVSSGRREWDIFILFLLKK